jgi:hypothetical protein
MRLPTAIIVLMLLGCPEPSHAQFAEPPPDTNAPPQAIAGEHVDRWWYGNPPPRPASWVRLYAGPAARLSEQDPQLGAQVAIEVGGHATGLRLAGAWFEAGNPYGVSQYTAEFWLDLAWGDRVHPLIGVGPGLARLHRTPELDGGSDEITIGLGVLRTGLQLALPVRDTDARASLEALASLPVAGPERMGGNGLWAVLALSLAVGF